MQQQSAKPESAPRAPKVVTVSVRCPFCRGTAVLFSESASLSSHEITDRYAGTKISCEHHDCGRAFWIRYLDLTIRRTDR